MLCSLGPWLPLLIPSASFDIPFPLLLAPTPSEGSLFGFSKQVDAESPPQVDVKNLPLGMCRKHPAKHSAAETT